MPTNAHLTPEDRLREVAAILAEGYLRLTRGRRNASEAPPVSAEADAAGVLRRMGRVTKRREEEHRGEHRCSH